MRKTMLGGLAGLALSCSYAVNPKPEDITRHNYTDVHNEVLEIGNGLRRVERVTCSDAGSIELQLNYKDANNRTKFLLTMERDDSLLFCNEVITAVDATQEFSYMGILYDDVCNGTVDRFSQAPIGDTINRRLHYRSTISDDLNQINDNEFGALRRHVDSIFDIEQKINACEEILD